VIAIDAVVLQASGIKLTDRAGLTTELALNVSEVVPELIESAVGLVLNVYGIVAGVRNSLDQMLTLGPGLAWPE